MSAIFHFYCSAVRSGGYDLFKDIDDKFDFDTINQSDSEDDDGIYSPIRKRLKDKMSLSKVTSICCFKSLISILLLKLALGKV